jgi:DNA-binding MarR family transcriptional regulator
LDVIAVSPTQEHEPSVFDEAGRALFRLGRVFARMPRRDLLDPPGLREPDLSAILLVQAVEDAEAAGEEATVGALAAKLGVDPSTASRLVAQAVRGWYLRRVARQEDGRAVVLALTDAGRDLAAGAARYQRAVFEEATGGWSPADRATFARLFVRFAGGVAAMLPGGERRGSGTATAEVDGADDGSRALVTVAVWHAAVNGGDPDRAAALVHPDVEMAGPRGDAVGKELLRDWATHVGIRLEPLRWFRRGDLVVVEQRAAWRDPATDAFGDPMPAATVFRVTDGLIARVARHPDLATALAEAGLTEADDAPGTES